MRGTTRRAVAGTAILAASALVSVVATKAPAARASTTDVTLRCTVREGQRQPYVKVYGSATVRSPGAAGVYTASKVKRANGTTYFLSQIALDAAHRGLTVDNAFCRRTKQKVALKAGRLSQTGTVTTSFLGQVSQRCPSTARVLVHVRMAADAKGLPKDAQIAVVDDNAHRTPIADLQWSPARVHYALAGGCVDS